MLSWQLFPGSYACSFSAVNSSSPVDSRGDTFALAAFRGWYRDYFRIEVCAVVHCTDSDAPSSCMRSPHLWSGTSFGEFRLTAGGTLQADTIFPSVATAGGHTISRKRVLWDPTTQTLRCSLFPPPHVPPLLVCLASSLVKEKNILVCLGRAG